MVERPSWEEYFLQLARVVATRSTCTRRQVGAVLVRDKRILATGYNGVPAGLAHCTEVGCLREELGIPSGQRQEICRGLHGEQNALLQCALHGIPTAGSILYCTHEPCVTCAKMLVGCGVQRVVFLESYPDPLGREILREAGVVSIRHRSDEAGESRRQSEEP